MPLSNSLNYEHPGFQAGKYYQHTSFVGSYDIYSSLFATAIVYSPIFIPLNVNIDRLAIYSCNNSTNNGLVRLGIYSNKVGLPSNLILDTGAMPNTGYTYQEKHVNLTLTSGWYWLAGICSIPNDFYSFYSINISHFVGAKLLGEQFYTTGYRSNFNYGNLPVIAPVDNIMTVNRFPVCWYRVAL